MHYLIYDMRHTTAPLLSPADLDPHEQAAYATRGERYLLERSLLKHELQRLTGIPARELRFTYSALGKPELAAQPFSLSHSGHLLCLAFHHRRVGVDIEQVRERARLESVAARVMCPAQLAAWRERGCRLPEFYACWCAAEALTKLQGGAIWQAQQRPFLYHEGRILPQYEGAPAVELFQPAEGYWGAVATEADSAAQGAI